MSLYLIVTCQATARRNARTHCYTAKKTSSRAERQERKKNVSRLADMLSMNTFPFLLPGYHTFIFIYLSKPDWFKRFGIHLNRLNRFFWYWVKVYQIYWDSSRFLEFSYDFLRFVEFLYDFLRFSKFLCDFLRFFKFPYDFLTIS